MEFNYHRQLVAQKGACAPRSYYIPFPEPEFSFDKGRSAFVTELKNWQFGYFPSLPEDALGADLAELLHQALEQHQTRQEEPEPGPEMAM